MLSIIYRIYLIIPACLILITTAKFIKNQFYYMSILQPYQLSKYQNK